MSGPLIYKKGLLISGGSIYDQWIPLTSLDPLWTLAYGGAYINTPGSNIFTKTGNSYSTTCWVWNGDPSIPRIAAGFKSLVDKTNTWFGWSDHLGSSIAASLFDCGVRSTLQWIEGVSSGSGTTYPEGFACRYDGTWYLRYQRDSFNLGLTPPNAANRSGAVTSSPPWQYFAGAYGNGGEFELYYYIPSP